MIKKTLYFGNPAYLSLSNSQLVVERGNDGDLPFADDSLNRRTIPVEDIGVVVLDNRQITITSGCMSALLDNNVAIVSCDWKSMPTGLMLPLCGNTIQSERFRDQIDASLPLKKHIWQQTIEAKVNNQAAVLKHVSGREHPNMTVWANSVRSGDSENVEARAAAYYWKNVFPSFPYFTRDRNEAAPNNLLNYGYAVLRAVVARTLVAGGLMPTLGVHHRSRYNAYCLADDIMEPYRPYVDKIVADIVSSGVSISEISKEIKSELLSIPVVEVVIDGRRSPLAVAAVSTVSSLNRCFAGEGRRVLYPEM